MKRKRRNAGNNLGKESFCPNCNRIVEGKKNFHGVIFTLFSIFVWLPGIWIGLWITAFRSYSYTYGKAPSEGAIFVLLWFLWMLSPIFYTLYHIFGKTPRCPICNRKLEKTDMSIALPKAEVRAEQVVPKTQPITTYKKCPKCDGLLETTTGGDVWWCKTCNKYLALFSLNVEKDTTIAGKEYDCYEIIDIGSNTMVSIDLNVDGGPINFYIMTPENFESWKHGRDVSYLMRQEKIEQKSFQWLTEKEGIYCIVFDNTRSNQTKKVSFKIRC